MLAVINWNEVGGIAIAIVVLAGIIALVTIGLKAMGVTVPDWIAKCLWVLLIVIVIVFCIKLVIGML